MEGEFYRQNGTITNLPSGFSVKFSSLWFSSGPCITLWVGPRLALHAGWIRPDAENAEDCQMQRVEKEINYPHLAVTIKCDISLSLISSPMILMSHFYATSNPTRVCVRESPQHVLIYISYTCNIDLFTGNLSSWWCPTRRKSTTYFT
jgi:hypothetical protein